MSTLCATKTVPTATSAALFTLTFEEVFLTVLIFCCFASKIQLLSPVSDFSK